MLAGLSEDVLFDGLIQQRLRLHYNSGLVRCSFGRTYFLGSLPRFRRATAQKNSPQILPAHSYAEKKEEIREKSMRQGKENFNHVHVYTYRSTFGKYSYAPLDPHFV